MNSIQIIETMIIGGIIIGQGYFAYQTFLKIKILDILVPIVDKFKIIKVFVPNNDLSNLKSENILGKVDSYLNPLQPDYSKPVPDSDKYHSLLVTEINVILVDTAIKNPYLSSIITSINTYLLRNSGATTDFNLVKDIVERNVSQLEDEIETTISVPLYLGLLGTMVGIILGLWNMDNLGDSKDIGTSITGLLGAVKWAMGASFLGLLCTIFNSAISIPTFTISFKTAKNRIEKNKNDFYTFIQTELLPKINNSLDSTFESLQRNLSEFNKDFKSNLASLNNVFKLNQSAIDLQYKTFEKLEKLDLANIAKFNITVLQQMEKSLANVGNFNTNIESLNNVIYNSDVLASNLKSILERTENFEDLASTMNRRLEESENLLIFLNSHFKTLNSHKQVVSNSVAEVGYGIDKIFSDLREHIQSSTGELKNFTIDEVEIFKKAMSDSRTNLSNLQFLESLNKEVISIKKTSLESNSTVNSNMQTLNAAMLRVAVTLEEMQKLSITHNVSKLFGFKTSSQSEVTKLNQKSNN